jgi:DNA-binding transcriptional regulator YiaG
VKVIAGLLGRVTHLMTKPLYVFLLANVKLVLYYFPKVLFANERRSTMPVDPERIVYIYGLVDPASKCLGYVGSSVDPETRRRAHISDARRWPRSTASRSLATWLNVIFSRGEEPLLVILDAVPSREAVAAEDRWISAFRASSTQLCNKQNAHRGKVAPKPIPTTQAEKNAKYMLPASAIQGYRERQGISQAELARRLGVHYSTVSRWERGPRNAPTYVFRMIELLEMEKRSKAIPP